MHKVLSGYLQASVRDGTAAAIPPGHESASLPPLLVRFAPSCHYAMLTELNFVERYSKIAICAQAVARTSSAAYVNQLWSTANATQAAESMSLPIQQQAVSTEPRSSDAPDGAAEALLAASAIALSPPAADQPIQPLDSVDFRSRGSCLLGPPFMLENILLSTAINSLSLSDNLRGRCRASTAAYWPSCKIYSRSCMKYSRKT